MGHNFVRVGEEYDNGSSYSGVNSASNLTVATTKWGHWLSHENIRVERAVYRLLVYPWADLSLGEQSFTFSSDGEYSRWYLHVSVSAAGEEDSLEFRLNGEVLPWESRGFDDREFYSWYGYEGLSQGTIRQYLLNMSLRNHINHSQVTILFLFARRHHQRTSTYRE